MFTLYELYAYWLLLALSILYLYYLTIYHIHTQDNLGSSHPHPQKAHSYTCWQWKGPGNPLFQGIQQQTM